MYAYISLASMLAPSLFLSYLLILFCLSLLPPFFFFVRSFLPSFLSGKVVISMAK